ncbi:MAG: hypothetical protein GEV28_38095 [Actinophytocola sp.]|uniref:hypothetical protein n=1 Tax=Actinophytocola sp. TaxID=1872138 RepID=UPI001328D938|nr:hypothetical protein [Actinophytocola sp.]MPZ85882.1 hypothetical protein [Actinophytocola sp.]
MHSEVFHRLGSRFVVQVFKPDCPELTVDKLHHEYAYLRTIYAELPRLIPRQRLVQPRPGAPLQACALVKDYIPHRADFALHRVDPARLAPGTREQIARFLHITRRLLATTAPRHATGTEAPMLPDIIDPDCTNLVVNVRSGDLALIDTNRLISTRKLARLAAAGQHLDPAQHRIHGLLLRRLMFLEAKYLGRTRAALRHDPVYARYVGAAGFEVLCVASAEAGEPIP